MPTNPNPGHCPHPAVGGYLHYAGSGEAMRIVGDTVPFCAAHKDLLRPAPAGEGVHVYAHAYDVRQAASTVLCAGPDVEYLGDVAGAVELRQMDMALLVADALRQGGGWTVDGWSLAMASSRQLGHVLVTFQHENGCRQSCDLEFTL